MLIINKIIFTFILVLGVLSPAANAGTVFVPGGLGDIAFKVTSLKEARFKATVRQQYDFSCGSAALATLLTFHYEDPLSEQEVFMAMYEAGDKEKIKKDGFSLLDIKNYLKKRGYQADGYRTKLDKLQNLGIPAIVLMDFKGYRHFVVVKGVTSQEVLLGDPSHGVRRVSRDRFESMWNGLLFLIRDKRDVATNYFNQKSEWHIHAKAPFGMAVSNNDLANITWLLPGQNDF